MFVKRFVFCVLTMLSAVSYSAVQNGIVYDNEGNPVPFANITINGTTIGTNSDTDGKWEIDGVNNGDKIIVSFAGFNDDTITANTNTVLKTTLKQIELEGVEVVAKTSMYNSRSSVVQVQSIGVGEITRAACCNLSESFQTNASVDVSYSDAATGAKQIRLLGLAGQYVQMTVEKIPNFRGLAAPYGLGYMPSTWMHSIQIAKGASSVVDGYESMTGQINIEMKKPQNSKPFSASAFINSELMYQIDVDGAIKINDNASTMLFAHYEDSPMSMDKNNDGFKDMPQVRQGSFFNRWYFEKGRLRSQLGLKWIGEHRNSGQMNDINNDDNADLWKMDNKTNRFEVFAKEGVILDQAHDESIGFILSANYHDQKANYGLTTYNASQLNTYLNAIYERHINKHHEIKAGASNTVDHLNEFVTNISDDKNTDVVTGLFAEYGFHLHGKFTALAGIRADYSSLYKEFFFTPRLHLKFTPTDFIQIRVSGGRGSRTPHPLAENVTMFASSRKIQIAEKLKREYSWNCGASLQFTPDLKHDLSIVTEYYFTDFTQQTVIDYDTNPHNVYIYNLNGTSRSHSFQTEISYEPIRGLSLVAAYRLTDVKQTIGGEYRTRPLVGRNKGLFTIAYETKLRKWQFDFTTQLNGGGRLPDSHNNGLWNNTYKAFPLFNFQVTRHFKRVDLFMGCENIGGKKQKNPIIDSKNPWGQDFDASMIYAPIDGRKFYVNVRYILR